MRSEKERKKYELGRKKREDFRFRIADCGLRRAVGKKEKAELSVNRYWLMGGNVIMRKSNRFVWGDVAGGGTECQRLHEVSLGDRCADGAETAPALE
jgi:hypothetical protein